MIIKQWQQLKQPPPNADEYRETFDYICEGMVEVEPSSIDGMYFISTGGVSPHTDDDFPQYAYHLVLVNGGLIAKGEGQILTDLEPQPPGTILILDNWQPHHAIEDQRVGTVGHRLWVSICFDCATILPDEDTIDAFKDFL